MKADGIDVADILLFFIALFSFVHVDAIGSIYIVEVILLFVFIYILPAQGNLLNERFPRYVIIFGLLWLGSQIATDLIRHTPLHSLLRGWASIALFLIEFCTLYMLLTRNKRRMEIFILGFALGGMLGCVIQPGAYYALDHWKFGFGVPVSLFVVLLVSWGIQKGYLGSLFGVIVLLALGILSIYLNARSLGAAAMIAAVLYYIGHQRFFYKTFLEQLTLMRLSWLILLCAGAAFLMLGAYKYVGESEFLPTDAQYKYELNKTNSFAGFGMILAARLEVFSSIPAVMDSPVIGHGSWAEDSKYRQYIYIAGRVLGLDKSDAELDAYIGKSNVIPTHSHLMQAWVWSGLLGACFWLLILMIIAKAFVVSVRNPHEFVIITMFLACKATWDLFFSPFGGEMRILWAWGTVFFIMSIDRAALWRAYWQYVRKVSTQ